MLIDVGIAVDDHLWLAAIGGIGVLVAVGASLVLLRRAYCRWTDFVPLAGMVAPGP